MRVNISLIKEDPRSSHLTSLGFKWCTKDCRYEANIPKKGDKARLVAKFLEENKDIREHSIYDDPAIPDFE